MQRWNRSIITSRSGPTKYMVTLYEVSLWQWWKTQLFHQVFCKRLFGTWHGWTWLGNKKWLPDQFALKDFKYKNGKWHKSRRTPLYTWSDLGCKLNTGQLIRQSQRHVSVELTPEQYVALGGKLGDDPDAQLMVKREDPQ